MPTPHHGRIGYVELPCQDPDISAAFYLAVFGWHSRRRDDGTLAFDDTAGHVSGAWMPERQPNTSGMLLYILVDDARAMAGRIRAHGGVIVEEVGVHPTELLALFLDPAGNKLGIYQGRA